MNYRILILCNAFLACNITGGSANEMIGALTNKHGKKAVLFKKNGGATVPNSFQVALLEESENISHQTTGNVFICHENSAVIIKWINRDSLQVQYSANAKPYLQQQKVKNITIVYKVQ